MEKVIVLKDTFHSGADLGESCEGCECELTLMLTEDGLEALIECDCGSFTTLVA